jgi:serine/threonine-protein kinase
MVGKTISHYRILKAIGDGGMGTVYKAEDVNLKRLVALKFLLPGLTKNEEAKQRFISEAQTASSLEHPNICTIHAIEENEEGQLFISMSFCEADTLRQELSTTPLPTSDALDITIQIAQGLSKAHENGIVHRDLKPENVGLTGDGLIKILDFGLAKLVGTSEHSQARDIKGTLVYMSPEQATGQEVDQRSDIWTLGVMLYEMLTGQIPFDQGYGAAILYSIAHEDHLPPSQLNPGISPEIESVINKAMQKSPNERYVSVQEMLNDIRDARSQLDAPPGKFSRFTSRSISKSTILKDAKAKSLVKYRKKPLVYVIGALLAVLLAAAYFPLKTWLNSRSVPERKHILVLPFSNPGGDKTNQAYSDGLLEILTSKLTQLEQFQESLWVVPTSEVRQSGISSASQAYKDFGVNLVISGSVQRTGDQIQLTMNLIDAKELRQLNSVVVADPVKSIAGFQYRVVSELINLVEFKLQPQSREILIAGNTTVSKAYDYYLQGRGYLVNYNDPDNIENAVELLSQAVKEDSRYALAYAGLGEAYWRKYEFTKDVRWVDPAIDNCNRALELSHLLAPVHITLGIIYRGTGEYDKALQELQLALQADPVNSDAFRELASANADLGRMGKAENIYLKAIEIKPSYWASYYDLGRFYYRNGEYQKAEAQFLKVTKLSPQNFKAYSTLGGIYLFMERPNDARRMFERSIEIQPNYGAYSNLGTLYFMQQNHEQAARMYEKALEINNRYYPLWGNLGTCYKLIPGERSKAETVLRRAVQLAEEKLDVNPNDPEVLSMIAVYYAELNMARKTKSYIEKALALAPGDLELTFRAAEIYAMIGDEEEMFAYLEELLKQGYSLQRIQQSPALQELKSEEKFQAFLKKYQQ